MKEKVSASIQEPSAEEKPKLTLFEAIELQDEAHTHVIMHEIVRVAHAGKLSAEQIQDIFAEKEILLGKTSRAWIEAELRKLDGAIVAENSIIDGKPAQLAISEQPDNAADMAD